MADFSNIIQEINDNINTNGVGAITGAKLNEVLRDMIAAVNAEKQDPLTIDATPTEDSTNPVQSGGMYSILERIFPNSSLFGGFAAEYTPVSEDRRLYFLTEVSGDLPNFELYNLPDNGKWKIIKWNPRDDAWDWETIDCYTSAQIDQLLSAVAAAISGKQDTIYDLSTIRSGAAAGATAYQKPSTGIPKNDLASGVQTSLGKADTAVQQVTVGTTTTGNAGTNASVTNSGTATAPVLNFTIPRGSDGADGQDGADAVNPFKGWWPDLAALKAAHTATAGDSAYVKDAYPATTWSIYMYDSTASSNNYWADSGTDADTSNVQTFASSQEVNEVHIVNDLTTGGAEDVLSAEQGVVLAGEVSQLEAKVTPIEAATDLLGWEFTYKFDKTKPSSALLNNPIVLSQEGDSLEVYVTDVPSTQNMNAGGYAFAGKNGSTRGNIALSYTGSVWVRADNDSWILQYGNGATGSTRRVKIVYNSASIDFYVDGTKVSTYNSLTPITIYTFGNANNSSNYGYWSGKIKELKVNGVDVYLSSIATLTNVAVEGNHSFLSPSDLEDSLTSTSTTKALAAKQGNVLKGLIDGVVADIGDLDDDVDSIEGRAFGTAEETTTTDIDEIPDVVKMAGYNAGPNGDTEVIFSTLSGYDSYYFYPSTALDAWLTDPGVSYIAISIVEDAQQFSINAIQGSSAYRKRKSENNLPTQENPLSIPEGSAVIVTVTAGKVVGFAAKTTKETFNGETPLAQAHIDQVLNEIEENGGGEEMYVSKTATQLDVYLRIPNGKYIHYPFWKRYKAYTADEYPSFYDNWGIGQLAIAAFSGTMADEANIFEPGEAELAMSVPSGKDAENNVYVGGQAHGFENIVTGENGREICILVDNQKVAEDAVLSLVPVTKVDIIQHTQICQAYTNTNPFADVTKHWVWENGKMSCTTSVKVLRSIFFRYAQFGMMCVYRRWLGDVNNDYLTNAAIKNDAPYKVWDVSDGWSGMLQSPDKNCTRIVEYGQNGLGFSMSVKSETVEDNGGMFVATNGLAYNKIYFDMGRSFTPSVNDVLEGTQTWEIF